MEELTLFCCTSAGVAVLATFFWARWKSRRVRLFSAVWMGPSIAVLSAVIFHLGTFIYQGFEGWKGLGLPEPSSSWGLLTWLRYTCISTIIPIVLGMILLVTAVLITNFDAHHALSLWDGIGSLATGDWLPDALGCLALGSLVLGPVPYGIFYGILGFLLGSISRVASEGVMSMQDPLALLAMTALVWVASLVSAVKTPAVKTPKQAPNP